MDDHGGDKRNDDHQSWNAAGRMTSSGDAASGGGGGGGSGGVAEGALFAALQRQQQQEQQSLDFPPASLDTSGSSSSAYTNILGTGGASLGDSSRNDFGGTSAALSALMQQRQQSGAELRSAREGLLSLPNVQGIDRLSQQQAAVGGTARMFPGLNTAMGNSLTMPLGTMGIMQPTPQEQQGLLLAQQQQQILLAQRQLQLQLLQQQQQQQGTPGLGMMQQPRLGGASLLAGRDLPGATATAPYAASMPAESGLLDDSQQEQLLETAGAAPVAVTAPTKPPPKVKRQRDKDRPKRPLSAYNIFFKEERAKLVGGISVDNGSDDEDAGATSTSKEGAEDDEEQEESSKPRSLKSVPEEEEKAPDESRKDDADEPNEEEETSSSAVDSKKRPPSELGSGDKKKRPSKKKKKKKGTGIGFADLAKLISAKWKAIDKESLARYTGMAAKEKERYKAEVEAYQRKKSQEMERSREHLEASVDESTKERYFSVMSERQRKKR